MPTPISPSISVTTPASAVSGPSLDLVLRPGTVVNAKVLQLLADDLVQIAIGTLALDVTSQVALIPGQNLQLAVSQNQQGIRLAVVGQELPLLADAVTLSPDAAALAPAAAAPSALTEQGLQELTPVERAAVTIASQAAVAQQASQAPLFADLAELIGAKNLPPALQQAVQDVLARQTPLDANLGGGDVETAFRQSGVLLEASLAQGSVPAQVPDLKAALLVLRRTLAAVVTNESPPALAAAAQQASQAEVAAAPTVPASKVSTTAASGVPLAPDFEPPAGRSEASRVAAPSLLSDSAPVEPVAARLAPAVRGSAAASIVLLQEIEEQGGPVTRPAMPPLPNQAHASEPAPRSVVPPPPFRGALPSAQPVASAALAPNATLGDTAHHLLDETDAALARQTLLQVASLPDRAEPGAPRVDSSATQWNFEIPFATPQGTAMAQFAIERDEAGAGETAQAQRLWRARFSLNVEPAGPVHALISLQGERTSVRLWAERPATAAQLRAGAGDLSQALARAELKPGEIVIRDGAPQPAAPARAGHFLDRAS